MGAGSLSRSSFLVSSRLRSNRQSVSWALVGGNGSESWCQFGDKRSTQLGDQHDAWGVDEDGVVRDEWHIKPARRGRHPSISLMMLLAERMPGLRALAPQRDVRVDQSVTSPHDLSGSDARLESSEACVAPRRELRAIAKFRDGDEGDEQVMALDVLPVHTSDRSAPSGQLSPEHVRVDDNRGTTGGHASAMAARNASSSSSVKSSITMSS